MKPIPEKEYHLLFRTTVIFKGLIAMGEIILGFLFAFVSYGALRHAALALFGDELTEIPLDLVWRYALRGIHSFTATPQSVWAFIFLSHGFVKLAFIWGLLRERMWAYPSSVAVFALFIMYQSYQLIYIPSFALWLITILDIVVVFLVFHEYRYHLRLRRAHLKNEQPS